MGRRGRPPKGAAHVGRVEASDEAKARLERIVQTLTGELTVAEACAELDLSESHFHRLRDRALAGAAEALEPRPTGRPRGAEPSAEAERVAELEARVQQMAIDLRAAELREEIALVMPHLLQPPREDLSPEEQKKRRNAAKRARRRRRGK